MATINGSNELIKESRENLSLVVADCDPALVPTLAPVLFGVTVVVAVDPPRAGSVAEWTATTADQRPATLLLHEDVPFDATMIGRMLVAQRAGEGV